MHQMTESAVCNTLFQRLKMGGEPQVIVFDVRDISAGSGHRGIVQMGFPDPLSLAEENEHLEARIAPRMLLCAFDRFDQSAIAHDKEFIPR